MKISFKRITGIALAAVMTAVFAMAVLPGLAKRKPPEEVNTTIAEKLVLNCDYARISLPVFQGLGAELDGDINKRIAEITGLENLLEFALNEENANKDIKMRYRALRKGDIFHISVATFVYAGGAHGQESRYEIYIDSRTGRFYDIDDLFKPRKKRQACDAIAKYIESLMEDQGDIFFEEASPLPLPDLFIIGRDGLKIIYPPLAIASYGEGFLSYEIPLVIYEKYLDKSGSFFSALKGSPKAHALKPGEYL